MNEWDVKPDNTVLQMTQRCSATALSVSHFLPCLVRKEILYMKTVRNNNTAQTLWENLCTRSVVPIFFFSCHFLVYNLVNTDFIIQLSPASCPCRSLTSKCLFSVLCILCRYIVLCIVFPFVFSCLFPIFVHIY